jgi:C4-dicarboxylate-specific signal transduction histidine kinase
MWTTLEPDKALEEALSTLSALLPNHTVKLSELQTCDEGTEAGRHSMVALRCANSTSSRRHQWRISEHPGAPNLTAEPKDPKLLANFAETQELGDQVVQLLSIALRKRRRESMLCERVERAERLFERALQTDKLARYGQVVAGVLHDLNNPLTAILSYADYLERTLPTQGCCAADLERLARIREAAERVLGHTRNLVEYARPAATQAIPCNLEPILRKALVFCDHDLTRAGVATALVIEPPIRQSSAFRVSWSSYS